MSATHVDCPFFMSFIFTSFFITLFFTTMQAAPEHATAEIEEIVEIEEGLSEYEIERGKPMPTMPHAVTHENLMDAFLPYKHLYRRLPEISLRLDGMKFVPDIALYPRNAADWSGRDVEMTFPPTLAIEILSPSQSIDEMKEKADKYFAAGTRSVWLVIPALAGVMVLHPQRKAKFFSEGELVDDALDIRINVEEIFE
jgi:Uma2 family endonuclease